MSAFTGITANLSFSFVGSEPLLLASQPLLATPTLRDSLAYANGLAAGTETVDGHWESVAATLAASASTTLTLSALLDTLPRTTALIDLRYLIIQVTTRTAGDYLSLAPGASHGLTALFGSGPIKIYRLFAWYADKNDSIPVVASTTDTIKLTNSGSNNITFNVFIGGNCS